MATPCCTGAELVQVREYRRMLVKEHEELYQGAIADTNKSMYCAAMAMNGKV